MGAVGFKISNLGLVREQSRYVAGLIDEYFEAVVTYKGTDLDFKSSDLIGKYPLGRVTLTRPLQEGQDFTYLPASKRPSSMTLSYSQEDMGPETLAIVMDQLMIVGQKRISTDELDPDRSKIEFENDLVAEGKLRFYQVFQAPQIRRNCSFEIDINPRTQEWFNQGLLPNHTKQKEHFCADTPTIPLFPIPLGVHIRDFVAFFNRLQNLPSSEFNELFKGMALSPQFAIYYGNHPYTIIASGFGGHKLDMEVNAEDIGADKVAKSFRKHIRLFDQFYAGFKPYSKYPVVMS